MIVGLYSMFMIGFFEICGTGHGRVPQRENDGIDRILSDANSIAYLLQLRIIR